MSAQKNLLMATVVGTRPQFIEAAVVSRGMVAGELPVASRLHPRTRAALANGGMLEKASQHIRLTSPVGYMDMLLQEKNARLVATDSGGVRKVAFFYRVPCVILREEIEWVELVALGRSVCVSSKQPTIVYEAIVEQTSLTSMLSSTDLPRLYGKGDAGSLIAEGMLGSDLI